MILPNGNWPLSLSSTRSSTSHLQIITNKYGAPIIHIFNIVVADPTQLINRILIETRIVLMLRSSCVTISSDILAPIQLRSRTWPSYIKKSFKLLVNTKQINANALADDDLERPTILTDCDSRIKNLSHWKVDGRISNFLLGKTWIIKWKL